jgi:hypothetical protein
MVATGTGEATRPGGLRILPPERAVVLPMTSLLRRCARGGGRPCEGPVRLVLPPRISGDRRSGSGACLAAVDRTTLAAAEEYGLTRLTKLLLGWPTCRLPGISGATSE